MSWTYLAAAALQAGASLYGADKASGKQASAAQRGIDEQQRQFNVGLNMLEPQRGLGYGAMSDIASLYGYRLPEYTPLNALAGGTGSGPAGSSNWTVGSPIGVKGTKGKEGRIAGIDAAPWSNSRVRLGGTIDPLAGTVTIDHKKTAKQDKFSGLATNYLRGDSDALDGGKFKRIRKTIDGMREQGYQWTPGTPAPTAGVDRPEGGTNAMFDRFRQMPGYQFGMQEGIKGIEQSAAARGGALSGNALRGVNQFAQDYAGTKFGEEMNRLFNIAGMGQTATNSAIGLGQNYANNYAQGQQNIGDARASGVLGATNAIGQGAQNYLMWDWMRKQGQGGGSGGFSQYGPWGGGYRMPGG